MKNALAILVSVVASMSAASEDIADQYPQSELYSKPVEVIPHVFPQSGQPHRRPMKIRDTIITYLCCDG